MAAAAGRAPVLRQSGKSRTLRRACGGDMALKRVFCQSAFGAVMIRDPISTAFYARKRRESKRHNQAIIALARRRVTVLWTMIRQRKPFQPIPHCRLTQRLDRGVHAGPGASPRARAWMPRSRPRLSG